MLKGVTVEDAETSIYRAGEQESMRFFLHTESGKEAEKGQSVERHFEFTLIREEEP